MVVDRVMGARVSGGPAQVEGAEGAEGGAVPAPLDPLDHALQLAQTDPRRAREVAARAARDGRADPGTRSRAERALGLAAKELNEIDLAVAHFRSAIGVARRAGLDRHEAEARMSMALTLTYRGEVRAALRQIDLAAPALDGLDAARLEMQRAIILTRMGRQDDALDGYRRALGVFRQLGDQLWECRLLCNRGALHGYRSQLGAARTDLLRALELSEALGQQLLTAAIQQNLGFIEAHAGNIPAALARYDEADAGYRALDAPRAVLFGDRCEALLSVGLYRESRTAAAQAVGELTKANMAVDLAEARLTLARAALAEGDPDGALEAATQAERAFVRQQRRAWALLARSVSAQARWVGGDRSPTALRAAGRLADDLSVVGWAVAAIDARVMAARIALERGEAKVARRELRRASRARSGGPVATRVAAWHAEALLRLAESDRKGADRAAHAGVELVQRYRLGLGATELRAHAFGHATELAAIGVRLAVEDGAARRALAWSERAKAGALLVGPVRAPADGALATDLAELRQVIADVRSAVLEGRPTARVLRQQTELEASVQRRARQSATPTGVDLATAPALPAVLSAVADAALVSLVDVGGHLHAVVVSAGRIRLVALAPVRELTDETTSLRFAIRRLASGRSVAASVAAAGQLLKHSARRLDDLLLRPLHRLVGDRDLIVVPTGPLHALPWATLPSCAGRSVTVAPSVALWLTARVTGAGTGAGTGAATGPAPAARTGRSRALLVAGPGVQGGDEEVARLARRYTGAVVLTGDRAGVAAVTSAVGDADLAHIAAHGVFRADNPLFSALELADGPLTIYDMEGLPSAPSVMILSACDSGLSAVHPGDALMGLAGTLLSLGTRHLIAAVAPVGDHDTVELMEALHGGLQAGLAPARALAEAVAGAGTGGPQAVAARGSFVCFGAG